MNTKSEGQSNIHIYSYMLVKKQSKEIREIVQRTRKHAMHV